MAVTTHHAIPASNNVNKPNVKRLVYNMYRDMLGSYNDKANDIVDSLPRRMVREDQGITKQIESMIQQQTNSPGNYGNDQPCFAGPPPPPPPPGPCNLPSKRLSTEIPDRRLEPPACVQNAMMTKDKKPFTYTPGGLDLSQIKSPRMARRISRNAQAEGVSEPRQSPLAQPPGQLPPSALAAMQPNLPTPVFPPGGIPPPPPPPSNAGPIQSPPPPPPLNNIQPNVNKPVPPPQNFQRPDIKSIIPPNPTAMLRQTGGPMRRGPYPPEPVDEPTSPEKLQASNNTANKPQLGSLYIPPVKNQEIEENRNSPSNIQSPARNIHTPPSVQSPVLNKAPTPWLTQRVQPQQQSNVPAWAQREDSQPKSPPTVITKVMPVQIEQSTPKPNNVSSIQIQHRPQVFVVNPPQMYQHPMSPGPQQQQHSMSPGPQQQPHPMSPGPQAQKHSRIIPIQIEGSNSPTQMSPAANISRNDSVNQPQWRANGNVQRTQEIPNNQFRKLQLQEDDQNLMNRFKNQAPRNSPGPVIRTIPIQREDNGNAQQQYIPPSEQQAPADPRKYTGSAIPSRSFRMLQAMTSPNNTPCANTQSTENVENYANDPYYSQWGGYDPNYPPHPYWNNPYWAYYSQCYSPQLQQECQDENQTGEQNEQSEQDLNAQYQQYWDQYGYYYNYYPYSYPPVYSPHPFYHQNSDTDNEGAYSSCDEMTYYGALFANKPPKIPQKQQSETPNIIVTSENNAENNPENKSQKNEVKNIEKANSVSDSSESESDSESDADTEVGDQKPIKTKSGSLIAIKSVSDINIYEDSNNYPNDDQDANDDNSNDEESTEENEDEYSAYEEEEEIPHQLSVIFEDDNEVSDYESVRGKKPRQDSEHTLVSEEESFVTVGNGESDTDEEEEGTHTQSTVTVKLPLKLKCSRNEQNEPITTIIVEPTSEIIETHVTLKSPTPCKDKPKEDVSFTINIPSRKNSFETQNNSVTDSKLTDSTQDSDVSISISLSLKKISDQNNDSSDQLKCETKQEEEESESEEESDSDSDDNDEGSSSSSGDSSSDSSSESESEVENTKDEKDDMNDISEKEKQQILKLLARAKGIEKDETISMNVKDKIKSFEMHIRNESSNSRRNSSKSIVDMTDEEDSGVTSDMSRHISDTDSSECFPELRKMNKYRRAATHSRLFQLLQEEYNAKDEDENETQTNENNINSVKESLTLPLQIDQEESSSGINSPISPTVNDRLVKELVQSLLKRKKGKCFRNLPLEKLHAAALRILQEDMDRYDTISSSEDGGSTAFLSPLPTETVNSSPVQTPQEFFNGNYDDYSAYYSSWANMASDSENYDILPSRTFKLLQDHATGTKPYKNTVLAKCPRVLSGKNLPKELQKVTETRETPSPLLESNPDNKIEARAT
ncbi:uncharacterized protein LOC123297346 isoform X2 [Chrysoperla carnea]|uniref:uncharacterized protein LOC123297346 isoform X2 n=1 Tax=Chrysoperla carnea TaxID=189513 RepID=UPI001D05C752|nr:uncharacterized protein LOC123297346 isoform X2 [Chrysoperla carnea]